MGLGNGVRRGGPARGVWGGEVGWGGAALQAAARMAAAAHGRNGALGPTPQAIRPRWGNTSKASSLSVAAGRGGWCVYVCMAPPLSDRFCVRWWGGPQSPQGGHSCGQQQQQLPSVAPQPHHTFHQPHTSYNHTARQFVAAARDNLSKLRELQPAVQCWSLVATRLALPLHACSRCAFLAGGAASGVLT